MQGNSQPVTGYDFSGVADRAKQMKAYDSLPVTVRRALDAAPFEICCIATREFYRAHGARRTVQEIKDSASQFIRAAAMETGVPPCHSKLMPDRTRRSFPRTARARHASVAPP